MTKGKSLPLIFHFSLLLMVSRLQQFYTIDAIIVGYSIDIQVLATLDTTSQGNRISNIPGYATFDRGLIHYVLLRSRGRLPSLAVLRQNRL